MKGGPTLLLLTAGERISSVAHIASADGLVIGDITTGIEAAGIHARIRALLTYAGLGGRAFRIDGALRSTAGWRSNEGGGTRAGRVTIEHLALGVGAAGRWLARIFRCWWWLSLLLVAACERIAGVARVARAGRVVVDHLAAGKLSTGSWAGIDALPVDTGRLQRTLGTNYALRLAGWRGSQHACLAGTHRSLGGNMAQAVRSARVWLTRVLWHGSLLATVDERIASVALQATANGYVVRDIALRVLSTNSWARIHALLVQASLGGRAIGTQSTFRAATGVCVAVVIRQATADSVPALGIGTARLQVARIGTEWWRFGRRFDNLHTLDERIAGKSSAAGADGKMVLNAALGIDSAGAVARIATFLGDAGSIRGTVRVHNALGSAVGWRSNVVGQAGAGGLFVAHSALGIQSAWRWLAWSLGHRHVLGHRRRSGCRIAASEWITRHVRRTAADGVVIANLALGIQATSVGARIGATEFVAGLVGRTLGIDCALRLAVRRSTHKGVQA